MMQVMYFIFMQAFMPNAMLGKVSPNFMSGYIFLAGSGHTQLLLKWRKLGSLERRK